MTLKSNGGVRALLLALGWGVMGLISACAAFSSAEQTPATVIAPTTTPLAAAASTATAATGNAQTVRVELVSANSEARYRVREQLARLSFPNDAVGATKAITGVIVARTDGAISSAESKFQVDLNTLKSDETMRDNFIRRDTLQTNRYPYAIFVPTKIEGLTLPPPTAGDVSFKLIGDLTIRNVTKQVTWDVKGAVNNNEAKGTATTSFTFDYFNLQKPSVMSVLSVEDTIKLELDLHLRRVTEP